MTRRGVGVWPVYYPAGHDHDSDRDRNLYRIFCICVILKLIFFFTKTDETEGTKPTMYTLYLIADNILCEEHIFYFYVHCFQKEQNAFARILHGVKMRFETKVMQGRRNDFLSGLQNIFTSLYKRNLGDSPRGKCTWKLYGIFPSLDSVRFEAI